MKGENSRPFAGTWSEPPLRQLPATVVPVGVAMPAAAVEDDVDPPCKVEKWIESLSSRSD